MTPTSRTGEDAERAFLASIGTERWWLGDVCLWYDGDDASALVFPSADGVLLELLVYGPRSRRLQRAVHERLTFLAEGAASS